MAVFGIFRNKKKLFLIPLLAAIISSISVLEIKQTVQSADSNAEELEVRQLIKDIAGNDESARTIAIKKIYKIDTINHLNIFIEGLKNDSGYVREISCKKLAQVRNKQATPFLIEVLNNDDLAYVRHSAAVALGKIRDKTAIKALLKASLSDNDEEVRKLSVVALRRIGTEIEAGILIDTLNKNSATFEKSPYVRDAVVTTVGYLGNREYIDPLLQYYLEQPGKNVLETVYKIDGQYSAKATFDILEKNYSFNVKKYIPKFLLEEGLPEIDKKLQEFLRTNKNERLTARIYKEIAYASMESQRLKGFQEVASEVGMKSKDNEVKRWANLVLINVE